MKPLYYTKMLFSFSDRASHSLVTFRLVWMEQSGFRQELQLNKNLASGKRHERHHRELAGGGRVVPCGTLQV